MSIPPRDIFGIVYIVENAQQFWSELEDILHIPDGVTLDKLDATLRRFATFCAAYHEQYLQSPLQMVHACDLLLASELFMFHSERMSEILCEDVQKATDPHLVYILYTSLFAYGCRNQNFLRSQKRWQPLLPLLMDNVTVDVDPDVEDTYLGSGSGGSGIPRAIAVPIEAKLRTLSVRLLYEVCRVQKLSIQELEIFSDSFIDYLFDLVEQTRHMQDETFNYSVIKLLVALNEQFMIASLHHPHKHSDPIQHGSGQPNPAERPENGNRLLRVLMARQSSSMTFGENMIFMLNRAERTSEDLCMQLLVLKLLYLLFTTKGMAEYFYTNDLCVLVDVFLREIGNIDEDNEPLRHTFLRVLHPLLTKTQLRTMPYKRAQIVRTLESLIENETIRDVDPTTKRLVERCLSGEWCIQFRKTQDAPQRVDSPSLSVVSSPQSTTSLSTSRAERKGSIRGMRGKVTRSAENLNANISRRASGSGQGHLDSLRQPHADSTASLPKIASAFTNAPSAGRRRERIGSMDRDVPTAAFASLSTHDRQTTVVPEIAVVTRAHDRLDTPTSPVEPPDSPMSLMSSSSSSHINAKPHRRVAPPPPTKRRKPPAVPAARGAPTTALSAASSQPSLTSLLPKRR
ncbi:hypothetical protein WOLCODRAFT_109793 [Wolfiporia cocos MD-104 SS10]|uniref:SPIN90/Ldb17 leucine-rich domain-containing protein n=1 Tax=Wolfiporia cocos (strain MD-104) TaxID=742152 RepID=A0A2H3J568_WOLCO|nr:hypothetical protein WOLCODRAFT_109793 [Wolfiporia cocos MD-104 SS10]